MTTNKLITTAQVAAHLGLSRYSVSRMARAGALPHVERLESGAYVYDPDAIEQVRIDRANEKTITCDALARELGCTLADLDDLGLDSAPALPWSVLSAKHAAEFRAAWTAAQK